MVLYKHGVGFFERRGPVEEDTLRLTFPRQAMDDVLKSLLAIDMGSGHVLSLDFETPEDREELLDKGSIHLSDTHTFLDLMRDLRGRMVRCRLADAEAVEGVVVGVDHGNRNDPLQGAIVSLYQQEQQRIVTLALHTIQDVQLLDPTASADLNYFLRASQSEEDRRSATLHLSNANDHDVIINYIAPAPSWRVSYRIMVRTRLRDESSQNGSPPTDPAPSTCSMLIQGWGLFDNQLEEDLEDVELTLVAGMPISFRYRLYHPHIPERPLIEDEERTVNAPLFFEGAPPPAPQGMPAAAPQSRARRQAMGGMDRPDMELSAFALSDDEFVEKASFSPEELEESVPIAASGSERGPLFAYYVAYPISVARGQSAMVPIIGRRLPCQRDLLYNRDKLPDHPVLSLRLTNETGHTLERGPVTIVEDNDYAGEAVIPFTRPDAELIIPYAVEMGIKVEEQHRSEQRIMSIHIRNDYLHIQEYNLRHTTYHLTSTLSKPVDVVIEHTLARNYALTDDTPEPTERSASFVRWSVPCPPQARTTFEAHERKLQSRHEHIRNLNGQQLQHFLKNKFLNANTINALQEILELYQQQHDTQSQLKRIEREREAIFKKQKQIQGNLAPLAQSGEEGALRKRYVTELNSQEDRLAAMAQEETRLHETIEALEAQARQKIAALSQ